MRRRAVFAALARCASSAAGVASVAPGRPTAFPLARAPSFALPPRFPSASPWLPSRALATGGRPVSGPFAVPHPKRADTLQYPARALVNKDADPLRPEPPPHVAAANAARDRSPARVAFRALRFVVAVAAAAELLLYSSVEFTKPESEAQVVHNWSATKEVRCERYVQPETPEQLLKSVQWADAHRRRLRPVGSALSPNGAAFNPEGMLSLAMLDDVLNIDEQKMTVTVRAGARVLELVEKLRPHGLTLANYASIREQQIGGFTQVGAHGTGASIPPLDDTVTKLKLVTPGKGVVELSEDDPREEDRELFRLARCGVGALGVASEVTLRVVPAHKLLERTWVTSRATAERMRDEWLKAYQHIRYMWIPHTDAVVVVASNPVGSGEEDAMSGLTRTEREGLRRAREKPETEKERRWKTAPMVRLLREVAPGVDASGMGFGALRDELLRAAPLDLEHVKRVNAAEAAFWRRNEGWRCDWSDNILGFDCGGQQHVYEVAFRTGDDVERNSGRDLAFMRELLEMIEREGIPAPAPIEQRWSAGSASPLSPASNDKSDAPGLHSWVGIIMYLPSDDAEERDAITRAFERYAEMEESALGEKYGTRTHWAKIELPDAPADREAARAKLARRYPGIPERFRDARKTLDPKGTLGNDMIEALLGNPERARRSAVGYEELATAMRAKFGVPDALQKEAAELFVRLDDADATWRRGQLAASLWKKAAAVAKFWEMLSTSAKMKKEEEAKKTGAVGEAMAAGAGAAGAAVAPPAAPA